MMNYIINPSWLYWINVLEIVKFLVTICCIFSLILISLLITAIISTKHDAIAYPELYKDSADRKIRFYKKLLIPSAFIVIILLAGTIFIPSRETLIEIMIAKTATAENAAWTVDAIKSAVDYVVSAIQQAKG